MKSLSLLLLAVAHAQGPAREASPQFQQPNGGNGQSQQSSQGPIGPIDGSIGGGQSQQMCPAFSVNELQRSLQAVFDIPPTALTNALRKISQQQQQGGQSQGQQGQGEGQSQSQGQQGQGGQLPPPSAREVYDALAAREIRQFCSAKSSGRYCFRSRVTWAQANRIAMQFQQQQGGSQSSSQSSLSTSQSTSSQSSASNPSSQTSSPSSQSSSSMPSSASLQYGGNQQQGEQDQQQEQGGQNQQQGGQGDMLPPLDQMPFGQYYEQCAEIAIVQCPEGIVARCAENYICKDPSQQSSEQLSSTSSSQTTSGGMMPTLLNVAPPEEDAFYANQQQPFGQSQGQQGQSRGQAMCVPWFEVLQREITVGASRTVVVVPPSGTIPQSILSASPFLAATATIRIATLTATARRLAGTPQAVATPISLECTYARLTAVPILPTDQPELWPADGTVKPVVSVTITAANGFAYSALPTPIDFCWNASLPAYAMPRACPGGPFPVAMVAPLTASCPGGGAGAMPSSAVTSVSVPTTDSSALPAPTSLSQASEAGGGVIAGGAGNEQTSTQSSEAICDNQACICTWTVTTTTVGQSPPPTPTPSSMETTSEATASAATSVVTTTGIVSVAPGEEFAPSVTTVA